MRLLNVTTFDTEEFFHNSIPKYTILSHTWGDDKDEIKYHDIKAGRIKDAASRPTKLARCCEQTRKDGYQYTWIDTCCIDQTNSVELGEAINSMFRWYANAAVCYAYLSDVPANVSARDTNSAMESSRWFTRGWTLQELLAPREIHFYNSAWSYMGMRSDLSTTIQQITRISRPFLIGMAHIHEASVAQRMSWASNIITKREEDMAYCLLGLFELTMPMIYGEGGEQAFARLQEMIIKHINDDSILVWGINPKTLMSATGKHDQTLRILASRPADFAKCHHVVSRSHHQSPLDISGGRLRARLALHKTSSGNTYGLLNCGPDYDTNQILEVPLMLNSSSGLHKDYVRTPKQFLISSPTTSESSIEQIQILIENRRTRQVRSNRQNGFYIEDTSQIGLDLIDVDPSNRWQKCQSIISNDGAVSARAPIYQQTLARLRSKDDDSSDFIILLEFGAHKPNVTEARCHIMICSRETTLESLSQALGYLAPKVIGKRDASNGALTLRVRVTETLVVGQSMFIVKLETLSHPAKVTVNGTEEIMLLQSDKDRTRLMFSDKLSQYHQYMTKPERLYMPRTEKYTKLLTRSANSMHDAKDESTTAAMRKPLGKANSNSTGNASKAFIKGQTTPPD
ncbi:heterokaryon incompatibility protein-domain-containing protein [Astrocystis sublimbata]|nr:heterokaryon incompatibility protein-domain-containing protein [Astrocystis sublimbata]